MPREIGILSVAGTTSAVGDRGLKTDIIVKPKVIPWPGEFMFPLSETEKESGCIYMERLRLLEGTPIFYDINYIANINLPRFTSRQFKDRSLFQNTARSLWSGDKRRRAKNKSYTCFG